MNGASCHGQSPWGKVRNGCKNHLKDTENRFQSLILPLASVSVSRSDEGCEQVFNAVRFQLIHGRQILAQRAVRKPFPLEPFQIMDRQRGDVLTFMFAEGHFGKHQLMKEIGIGAYEHVKFRIVGKRMI